MRTLDRKILRDLRHLKGQLVAITVLVACGVAVFIMLRSMYGYLRGSQDRYYADYGFGDVFAHATRAPLSLETRVASVPGVAAVQTRIVQDVILDVPGLAEPATGRLVSLPDRGDPRLNRLHLRTGALPDPRRRDQVVVSAAFAAANGLRVGDPLGAVLNGRWQRLTVVGTAISPEFIYELRGGGAVFPDNRRFGAMWMGWSALAAAFDLDGSFNDLVLALEPGAEEPAVLASVDRLLEPYGGAGAYGRDLHVSHEFVSSEIEETQITSLFFPALFLVITAFLLNTTLMRLVRTEREQIGLMRAFGIGARTVAGHYVKLALVPVAAGAAVGAGVGVWLAVRMAAIYTRFYQFPERGYHQDLDVVLAALGIALGTGLVGALAAARGAIRLAPAAAMAPPAPPRFRHGAWERTAAWRGLGVTARMIVRGITRARWRSAATATGVALALGVLATLLSMFDAIDVVADLQFNHVARDDVAVYFDRTRPEAALRDVARLPGVLAVEPIRSVSVRLVHGPRSRRAALLALPAETRLRRIVDADFTVVPPPTSGMLLSRALADRLGAGAGATVRVEVTEGERRVRDLPVSGIVDEMMGAGGYVDLASLDRLVGRDPGIQGALLHTDPAQAAELYARLKRLPGVATVSVHDVVVRGFEQTIEESFMIALTTTLVLGTGLVMAIVYNQARIALSERGRDLASLRVLGFSRRQVAGMLLGEQGLLVLLALPFGVALGWAFTLLIMTRFTSDLFRMPVVAEPATYALAVAMVVGSAVASALLVRGRLDRIDLIAVLKTRE